jgi:hypothetical protein
MELEDGTRVERTRGTPQGGVVSPILANLFMHYTFDLWMARTFPELPWCRYADDGLVHCRVEHEAEAVKAALQARLAECRLEMHPTKTRIVYCRDGKRRGKYPNIKFDFLGYCFRPRLVSRSRDKTLFCSFNPAVIPRRSSPCGRGSGSSASDVEPSCRWQKLPNALIRSCGGGSITMGDTRHRRLVPCSGTSTSRYWLGRCGSSNASKLTRSARANFCKGCPGKARISSYIGGSARSARLPDGSRVTRECHARF